MVLELSRRDARRLAVRAQLLGAPRPTDVLEVVRRLTVVQVDMTAHVSPSADLVLWSRIGNEYDPDELDRLFEDRRVVELDGMLRPGEDVALFRAGWAAWPGPPPLKEWMEDVADWLDANRACHEDVIALLRSEGPLSSRDLPDTCVVPWRSSGWNDDRNVRMLVALLESRGEVAVGAREGRERLWDLADRVYPETPTVPLAEAVAERDRRRLRALGIARARATQHPVEPNHVGAAGEAAVVEGVRGEWRVDPELLDTPFRGRTALLSPLDRLVADRKRVTEVFEFEYLLEMYKPKAARRWGYWALPVLHGDRLVGKVDATADRDRGVLRVDAVHWDEHTTAAAQGVERELRALARWLGLELVHAG
ncbi:DNA glycosylase AlkZ-like family protein [Oryzobacter telluris]|uniref:DNA glycosylase AlkZ-like family protein n=1 Tax=Oryzobacter telluris TaxID=3149179 RepID=UPI00370D0C6A